jgi:hypothetical protein
MAEPTQDRTPDPRQDRTPEREDTGQRVYGRGNRTALEQLPTADLISEVIYRAKRYGADEKTPGLASRTGGLSQSKEEMELAESVLRDRVRTLETPASNR